MSDYYLADSPFLQLNASPNGQLRRVEETLECKGDGYLAGTFPGGITSINGIPTTATVRVVYRPAEGTLGDGKVVATTQSNVDGTWLIIGLNPALQFDVIGRKEGFRDVIVSAVNPTPLSFMELIGDITFIGGTGSGQLIVNGGLPPYTLEPLGDVPPGLTFVLDDATNTITAQGSGSPGFYTWSLRVVAANGAEATHEWVDVMVGLAWDPSCLQTWPHFWVGDESAMTVASGKVTQVVDLVGWDQTYSSPSEARRPTLTTFNGRQALSFDGVDDMLEADDWLYGGASQGLSKRLTFSAYWNWFFAVYDRSEDTDDTSEKLLFGSVSSTGTAMAFLHAASPAGPADTPLFTVRRNPADTPVTVQASAPQTAAAMIFAGRDHLAQQSVVQVNGGGSVTGAGLSTGNTEATIASRNFSIGGTNDGGGTDRPFKGKLLCMLGGRSPFPSQAEIDRLMGYAAHRYGLTSLLPEGHPYKEVPPVQSEAPYRHLRGIIASAYACNIKQRSWWNPAVLTNPSYELLFGNIINAALGAGHRYSYAASGNSTATELTGVFNAFDREWILHIRGFNPTTTGDTHTGEYEFLDENDNVIAAIRTFKDGSYRAGMWYGPSLTSLTKASSSGSYPNPQGWLKFTETQIQFVTDYWHSNGRITNWTYNCDVLAIRKIRYKVYALSTYNSGAGGEAGCFLIIAGNTHAANPVWSGW